VAGHAVILHCVQDDSEERTTAKQILRRTLGLQVSGDVAFGDALGYHLRRHAAGHAEFAFAACLNFSDRCERNGFSAVAAEIETDGCEQAFAGALDRPVEEHGSFMQQKCAAMPRSQ
jgi:hypothetical protein